MKTIGLDIGTSTLSAVVYDSFEGVLLSRTIDNDSSLPGKEWERLQNPQRIYSASAAMLQDLISLHPDSSALGISCQMHGILYLDSRGNARSPLYTWQDGRGNLPYDGRHSWADHLSEVTGYPLSTGYGLVTHLYNLHHNLVSKDAATLCTIGDYLAMKFSGRTAPLMDATNAASLGLYDVKNRCFDLTALKKAGMDPSILPALADGTCLGREKFNIPVFPALGDNQASFLGATGGQTDALLINMGTGGQVSVYSPVFTNAADLELRPFPDDGFLLVGASLCGGRSYALLEAFFRETVKMVTGQDVSTYDAMAKAMEGFQNQHNSPKTIPLFQGTRKDPTASASIVNLRAENFTPQHFIHSILQGMADELYAMYEVYLKAGGHAPARMIGSGNGLRKNPYLCRILKETFGLPMTLSKNEEEAACGAALYAASHHI